MSWLWPALAAAGLGTALFASRMAVRHAATLAFGSRLPHFVIGITLLALGTDLPEIAASVAAALSGHGDIVVGNSIGSATTQSTLILGLLPFLGGGFLVRRRVVGLMGVATVVALGIGVALVLDGNLSRPEGLMLVMLWLLGSLLVWKHLPEATEPALPVPTRRREYHVAAAVTALLLVGLGANVAVEAFIRISRIWDLPEYAVSFFLVSIGTSLPELLVSASALRQGQRDLGVGDLLGASLIDSTLSLGIGPSIAPTGVTASLAVAGGLLAMSAVALGTLLLVAVGRNTRLTGTVLVLLYAALYPLLLGG